LLERAIPEKANLGIVSGTNVANYSQL